MKITFDTVAEAGLVGCQFFMFEYVYNAHMYTYSNIKNWHPTNPASATVSKVIFIFTSGALNSTQIYLVSSS
jgi:hypothetical protein